MFSKGDACDRIVLELESFPPAGSLRHDRPLCPRHADGIGCAEGYGRISTEHHDGFAIARRDIEEGPEQREAAQASLLSW
jgi:hypothetical protein